MKKGSSWGLFSFLWLKCSVIVSSRPWDFKADVHVLAARDHLSDGAGREAAVEVTGYSSAIADVQELSRLGPQCPRYLSLNGLCLPNRSFSIRLTRAIIQLLPFVS